MICDCTNTVPCDPHRCEFVDDKGKRCRAPRIWESAGCTKHRTKMPRVTEDFEIETLETKDPPGEPDGSALFLESPLQVSLFFFEPSDSRVV